jgi:tRNA-dihydrouridine synthase B
MSRIKKSVIMNKTEFKNQLFLAPMAEITTYALRKAIRQFDKNVILYTEMLSAGTLKNRLYLNETRIEKFNFDDPIIFQILGNDPFTMSEACKKLSDNTPFAIDINMGCSAPEILKKKQGSFLLKNISSTAEIVRACRKATDTRLSVKMRIGVDNFNEEYLYEFINMLVTECVDFITIHGRISKLSFKRSAN